MTALGAGPGVQKIKLTVSAGGGVQDCDGVRLCIVQITYQLVGASKWRFRKRW